MSKGALIMKLTINFKEPKPDNTEISLTLEAIAQCVREGKRYGIGYPDNVLTWSVKEK